MSSLLKEDMEKKLFNPQGHALYEFIEIICKAKKRFYLCVSVTKEEVVQISLVKHYRTGLDDKYEINRTWLLKDLELIDGKEADTDNAHFEMHFEKIFKWEAYSCASKYSFTRSLIKLNNMYIKREIQVVNFDLSYINSDAIWSSNNGDCLVLMRICFYASNLLCLSLCPMP
ncbi:exocyst complex component 1-like [Ambystoma mexicanum]|uniref:exocyst complex component 1-like n=1 Tax=Ambystoma mexicanum TaxID=8296 RepID=UPI0037E91543